MHFFKAIVIVCLVVVVLLPKPLEAQRSGFTVIRDTEIETMLKEWSEPLLKAANIPPESIDVILVQSPQVNAFVAGGANIFFYTGLLEETDGPGEIMGVYAHELGHIAGGHLISTRDALERASYESILGTVLGIGAALLGGGGDAAGAVISGSQNIAGRRFLASSRINESSADQAALNYFEKAEFNPTGFGTFLGKLKSQELLPSSQQNEYVRTHPLTADRIETVKARIEKSAFKDKEFPALWIEQHARMKAKLVGFISPGRVAWEYDDRDQSIAARYARAIAAYRENRVEEAIEQIDALIADEPKNPYFHELKGQMLVDFSRIEDAIPPYRTAIDLLPQAALFRIALAHALIESGNREDRLKEAIDQLERAARKETRSSRIHRLLATAHGRLGDETIAKLHLAEEAVLQRRVPYAKRQAETVIANASPQSREYLRARDLLEYIKTLKPQGN